MSPEAKLVTNKITNRKANLPKRVFYVWNYIEWGGAQIYLFALMREAAKHAEVYVLIPRGSHPQLLEFLKQIDAKVEYFDAVTDSQPATTIRRKLERHFNKARAEYRLLKFLRQFDFTDSVIHIELAPWQSLAVLIYLTRKAKVFVTVHNWLPYHSLFRQIIWRTKLAIICRVKNFNILASNQDTRNKLAHFVTPEFLDRVPVTYTSVNPDELDQALNCDFSPEAITKKYKLPAKPFLVFCVGQFIDRKGRWIFLEAAKRLAATNSDIGFVWISNSSPSESDRVRISEFQLGESFRLITSAEVGSERGDLFRLMRAAKVFVLASYVEGLPISLLEAMGLGIPSISTNVYAIPEAIVDGETGILIEPGDADQLVNAIDRLKNDRQLHERLSSEGRNRVSKNFDERESARTAWRAYEQSFARENSKH